MLTQRRITKALVSRLREAGAFWRAPCYAQVMSIWIGTSGWSYGHWHGVLYPHGGAPYERLGHYVQRFATVELNASYYRWPGERAFAGWRKRLPDHFRLSVKAPGLLTHVR